jgi:DNA-binding GntR family transcriptional regulator
VSDIRTSRSADGADKSSFATSPVVNLVFDRVLTSVHEGRLLPGRAAPLGGPPPPGRPPLQRLRDIGIIEASASRFTRVALVTPKQTADAMVVWVALYSALVNEVIPLVTPEVVAAMRADHELFLEHVSWALDPKRLAELRANPQLVREHFAELVPQKIAMANAKFFDHLVGLSQNPSLVRGINSVVHLIQLGSLYLPDYLDFRALEAEAETEL